MLGAVPLSAIPLPMMMTLGHRILHSGLVLFVAVAFARGGEPNAPSGEAALQAPELNLTPSGKYLDDQRIFQGIPGIERAANGRLWATWYAGGPDEPSEGPGNFVVLVTSGDNGRTWSTPQMVIDPPGPVRAFDPALWRDPDGRLWLFWAQSYEWWDGRAGVWAVTTENAESAKPTWSAPRRLYDGIMLNKPIALSSGAWLLPSAIWERPPHFAGLKVPNAANVFRSTDHGATWELAGGAIVPERVFDEHMLVERIDGSVWMLVRAKYGIGESVSHDGGTTWSAGTKTKLPQVNSRFFVARLRSGKLLLVTHDPKSPTDQRTRANLVARLSDDDGKTWHGKLLIDAREGVSYPDAIEAPDGTIYVIYDYQRRADRQILMATFSEADVSAGAFSSPVARSRIVVNQATGPRPR